MSTAYSAAPRKLATISEVIVGSTSTTMMYERPLAADPGRLEEVPVAQRQRLRAQLAGAVRPAGQDSTMMITVRLPLPAYVASTMISGNVGSTRKMSVSIESPSSA